MVGAAVGTPTKVLEMRYLKYTIFEDVSSKYDGWALSFKRATRSVNCDAYDLLVLVERWTRDVDEQEMDELFGEIRTVECVGRTVRHVSSSVYG